MENKNDSAQRKAVLTVVGKDRPGIIAAVSTRLFEQNANILDINQTVMQGDIFTMIVLCDISNITASFRNFKQTLLDTAKALNMEMTVQLEEIFSSMNRI